MVSSGNSASCVLFVGTMFCLKKNSPTPVTSTAFLQLQMAQLQYVPNVPYRPNFLRTKLNLKNIFYFLNGALTQY